MHIKREKEVAFSPANSWALHRNPFLHASICLLVFLVDPLQAPWGGVRKDTVLSHHPHLSYWLQVERCQPQSAQTVQNFEQWLLDHLTLPKQSQEYHLPLGWLHRTWYGILCVRRASRGSHQSLIADCQKSLATERVSSFPGRWVIKIGNPILCIYCGSLRVEWSKDIE